MYRSFVFVFFFFVNDTATTEIYTLSLHDALPIVDEGDPTRRDPELDLFAMEPPFDASLLERYRAAQLARNRRITEWVKDTLAALGPSEERGFVVHGTMGDPRALDPAVDPNERKPGVSFLGDPRAVNHGPV